MSQEAKEGATHFGSFRCGYMLKSSSPTSLRPVARGWHPGTSSLERCTSTCTQRKLGYKPQVEEVKDVGSLNINPTVTRRSPVFKLTPPATRLLLQTKKQVNMAYGRKDDGDEWHQIQPAHCHTTYIEFSGLEDFSLVLSRLHQEAIGYLRRSES